MKRFSCAKAKFVVGVMLFSHVTIANAQSGETKKVNKKPNILFCIADDASLAHMTAYGLTDWVSTPGFDRVAKEGLLFMNAYTPNAKCSPSRAAILTGRNPWQLEEAGNHNPFFPAKFTTVMEALAKNGYATGFTGKGWSPGNPGQVNGQRRELTGKGYSSIKMPAPTKGIFPVNYTANFEAFLNEKPADEPFCFWYGGFEPHRPYTYGSGITKGKKKVTDIDKVPPYWIDNDSVRTDMLDYAFEVEYFDAHVKNMIELLEKKGELENTIIIVTSDNGMPFPRVKGHVYEAANHLPLAVMWKGHIQNAGRRIEDYISFIDLAPTLLDLAGVTAKSSGMQEIIGRSFTDIIKSANKSLIDAKRDHVLVGRERTDPGRPHDWGYPVRGIVKNGFIYTHNYEPTRWPSGNPETGFMDTDNGPTKNAILNAHKRGEYNNIYELNFGLRGADELYQITSDTFCMNNLAANKKYAATVQQLKKGMETELKKQNDPRMFGKGDVFDSYQIAKPDARNYYERFMKGEIKKDRAQE
jgi:N-sulfoglucosamine sulfohydrolase